MNQVIVTTPNELQEIINHAVRLALSAEFQPTMDENAWGWGECAEYLGIGTNTLRAMVANNEIPYFEIPSTGTGQKRIIRFHPGKIRAWEPTGHPLDADLSNDKAMIYRNRKTVKTA